MSWHNCDFKRKCKKFHLLLPMMLHVELQCQFLFVHQRPKNRYKHSHIWSWTQFIDWCGPCASHFLKKSRNRFLQSVQSTPVTYCICILCGAFYECLQFCLLNELRYPSLWKDEAVCWKCSICLPCFVRGITMCLPFRWFSQRQCISQVPEFSWIQRLAFNIHSIRADNWNGKQGKVCNHLLTAVAATLLKFLLNNIQDLAIGVAWVTRLFLIT